MTTWRHAALRHTMRRYWAPIRPPLPPPRPWPAAQGTGAARQALKTLVEELATCGFPVSGMAVTLTRLQAVLTLPDGLAVQCRGGWLLWPTGRASIRGRPLHTLHSVYDAVGAARRIAHLMRVRPARADAQGRYSGLAAAGRSER